MHTSGGASPSVTSRAAGSALELSHDCGTGSSESFSLFYVVCVGVVALLLGIVVTYYFCGLREEVDDRSYYYQDLNSVEMRIGKYPVDPDLVRSVHHFQDAPFGLFRGDALQVSHQEDLGDDSPVVVPSLGFISAVVDLIARLLSVLFLILLIGLVVLCCSGCCSYF